MKKIVLIAALCLTSAIASAQAESINPYEFYKTNKDVLTVWLAVPGFDLELARHNRMHTLKDVSIRSTLVAAPMQITEIATMAKGKVYTVPEAMFVIRSLMQGTISNFDALPSSNAFNVIGVEVKGKVYGIVLYWSPHVNRWLIHAVDPLAAANAAQGVGTTLLLTAGTNLYSKEWLD